MKNLTGYTSLHGVARIIVGKVETSYRPDGSQMHTRSIEFCGMSGWHQITLHAWSAEALYMTGDKKSEPNGEAIAEAESKADAPVA